MYIMYIQTCTTVCIICYECDTGGMHSTTCEASCTHDMRVTHIHMYDIHCMYVVPMYTYIHVHVCEASCTCGTPVPLLH
jgi:hypothetical protein